MSGLCWSLVAAPRGRGTGWPRGRLSSAPASCFQHLKGCLETIDVCIYIKFFKLLPLLLDQGLCPGNSDLVVPSNGNVYRALSALGAVRCVTSCPHKLAVCQPLLALCCKQSSLNPAGVWLQAPRSAADVGLMCSGVCVLLVSSRTGSFQSGSAGFHLPVFTPHWLLSKP